jgi:hypothetical protein
MMRMVHNFDSNIGQQDIGIYQHAYIMTTLITRVYSCFLRFEKTIII